MASLALSAARLALMAFFFISSFESSGCAGSIIYWVPWVTIVFVKV